MIAATPYATLDKMMSHLRANALPAAGPSIMRVRATLLRTPDAAIDAIVHAKADTDILLGAALRSLPWRKAAELIRRNADAIWPGELFGPAPAPAPEPKKKRTKKDTADLDALRKQLEQACDRAKAAEKRMLMLEDYIDRLLTSAGTLIQELANDPRLEAENGG